MQTMDNVETYFDRLRGAIDLVPREKLAALGDMLYRTYRDDKQVFTLGNGGSASTASHMAADLAKNTIGPNMHRFRIISLNDNMSIVTALANDLGYENVFSEQLMNLVKPGDLLIAISASGNSPNVLNAIRYAQQQCAEVAGIFGFSGGEGAQLADLSIVIPCDHYGIVEDVHLIINHVVVDYFQGRLADDCPWLV
jgi:D-sedoheptulose 7-phosphate isomerase